MKLKSSESNIWLSSDSHYNHANIVQGVSQWDDKSGCRDFETIDQMNQFLVNGINDHIGVDDTLIHLGDWSFGGIENIWRFIEQINCKNIHLIFGNHDIHIEKNKWVSYHHTLGSLGLQGLFKSTQHYLELTIDKQLIVLSHYPFSSWNRMFHGSWMLHGHSHGTLFQEELNTHWYKTSKIMDVGVDVAYSMFDEYRPFSFLEIKDIMSTRVFTKIDHHDEKTNR